MKNLARSYDEFEEYGSKERIGKSNGKTLPKEQGKRTLRDKRVRQDKRSYETDRPSHGGKFHVT